MTRRPYRKTPLRPVLRIVQDDRMPLDRRLERELLVRDFARRAAVVAFLLAVGGVGAVLSLGVVVALRWVGR